MANTKVTKLNVRLLRRVQRAILKHPDQFEMEGFFASSLYNMYYPAVGGCGTAACIAGWVVHLALKHSTLRETESNTGAIWVHAKRLLNLKWNQDERLFQTGYWPIQFAQEYFHAANPISRARVAAKRIDLFIKSKGAE